MIASRVRGPLKRRSRAAANDQQRREGHQNLVNDTIVAESASAPLPLPFRVRVEKGSAEMASVK